MSQEDSVPFAVGKPKLRACVRSHGVRLLTQNLVGFSSDITLVLKAFYSEVSFPFFLALWKSYTHFGFQDLMLAHVFLSRQFARQ